VTCVVCGIAVGRDRPWRIAPLEARHVAVHDDCNDLVTSTVRRLLARGHLTPPDTA
jgi:hypothetical protein